jgi:hypothetical protein
MATACVTQGADGKRNRTRPENLTERYLYEDLLSKWQNNIMIKLKK